MAANYKMAAENVLEKKQIIDSVTEYKLYPEFVPEHNNEERMEYLSFLGAQCVHAAKELTCGYIWNNDKFNLTVQANETGLICVCIQNLLKVTVYKQDMLLCRL